MKALITGITGFVGPYLSSHLVDNGFEVFGLDKNPGDVLNAKVFQADILVKDQILSLIDDIKPDVIFHLAGFSSVKKSFEFPELCHKINVDGTKNLFDAIVDSGLNPKVLVISSAKVYGNSVQIPISESAPLVPLSPYGKSRVDQEELCKNYDLPIIISRSFHHIGPGQQPFFVASEFAKQIVDIERGIQQPVIKTGNLDVKRDFTDVRDMVKAYLLAVDEGIPGEVYNLCSNNAISIKHLLDSLLSFSHVDISVVQDPDKFLPSDMLVLQGDNSKFIEQTGWHPEIPLERTLRDVLDFWRSK